MKQKTINDFLSSAKADAIISMSRQTRIWYSDVATTDGIIVIEKDKAYLFVDGRYTEYVLKNAKNVEIKTIKEFDTFLINKSYQKVLLEKDYLTVKEFEYLNNKLMTANVKVQKNFITAQELRIVKSDDEIKKIKQAISISLKAYNKVKNDLKVGMSEYEVAAALVYEMKLLGADKESFEPIVAFGSASAEPHHHPTKKKLKDGNIVKIDFGAEYQGYAADITRTFCFELEKKTKKELVKILEIVREASNLAIKAVRPGASTKAIDQIARKYIEDRGYGQYFVHSLGHGLGIDVHELPNLNQTHDTILAENMVITVEPGIYIPNLGGARIENDILVTSTGYQNLSKEK